jgi:D-sedoheptulose 7-phosphate isomerase
MGYASKYLGCLREALDKINPSDVDEIIEILAKTRDEGRTIFVVGNGGSAAAASHFATDLSKGTYYEGKQHFSALSLTDNISIITAFGNDFSFDDIFVGQLRTHFKPGDVVVAISGSGNSPNVIKAIEYANAHEGISIGLCGFAGGKLKEAARHVVHVPIEHYGLVEDAHTIILHVIGYFFMEQAGTMPKVESSSG